MLKNISKIKWGVIVAVCLLWFSLPACAKVTPDEAEHLKKDLTPMGAERAGNADGTIPTWTGGMTKIPEGINYEPGKMQCPNPFASEKPLFTITAQNMDQYAEKLSPAVKAMFRKFPDTFQLNIYPTHRTAAMPEKEYEKCYKNALAGELINNGDDGIQNALGGVPFPIPKHDVEAIYNHVYRWQGYGHYANASNIEVHSDGSQVLGATQAYQYGQFYHRAESMEELNNKYGGFSVALFYESLEPARRKGEINLVKDRLDFRNGARAAWVYMPGLRRVRRAPDTNYDTPDPTFGGHLTYDDVYMFNGRPDRFNWKLIEKKEMYIPYNTYDVHLVPYKEILSANHPNPKYWRWELHRVWVLESTLKEGMRHIYGKRIYYLDEDTWMAVIKENYDTRGNFWRWSSLNHIMQYDIPVQKDVGLFAFDMQEDFYYAAGMRYENKPDLPDNNMDPQIWTPQNVRKVGLR